MIGTIRPGDVVTTTVTTAAWYSHYAGLPLCDFTPADTGRVMEIDRSVFGRGLYALVDFEPVSGVEMRWPHTPAEVEARTWRVLVYCAHLRKVGPS